VPLTPLITEKVNFKIEYLCEYEALRLYPVDQGPRQRCMMKKPEVENLVTWSFKENVTDRKGNSWYVCIKFE
jgi:hypothetical protein